MESRATIGGLGMLLLDRTKPLELEGGCGERAMIGRLRASRNEGSLPSSLIDLPS